MTLGDGIAAYGKFEEKAPGFSAGMNPTPLPQTVFDVLNGCFP